MGGTGNQRTGKTNQKQNKAENSPETTSESEAGRQDHNERLRVRLATITKDVKDLKQEIRHKLITLKDELKKEINTLPQEIERKLTDNINELQTQKATQAEAQVRIAELEEWKIDAGEVMMEMLEQTRQMQEKYDRDTVFPIGMQQTSSSTDLLSDSPSWPEEILRDEDNNNSSETRWKRKRKHRGCHGGLRLIDHLCPVSC
ncbi:hypothetical protein F2P81_018415 [Scophthalmus maximus]|uniref:Uncharacterized protein n=1 Tax=Scophthalmus maximus TaxID=52904 RepID=A0A6A4SC54_SCOMX|nr:hypothetical protein F2P81_018415 [Scophthalmus maximus]